MAFRRLASELTFVHERLRVQEIALGVEVTLEGFHPLAAEVHGRFDGIGAVGHPHDVAGLHIDRLCSGRARDITPAVGRHIA